MIGNFVNNQILYTLTPAQVFDLLRNSAAGQVVLYNDVTLADFLTAVRAERTDGDAAGALVLDSANNRIVIRNKDDDGWTTLVQLDADWENPTVSRVGGANINLGKLGAGVVAVGEQQTIIIPVDCTLTKIELYSEGEISGDIELEILLGDYSNYGGGAGSIVASAPPIITGGIKSTDSTLTGWTKDIDRGDHLIFSVVSVTNIEQCIGAVYWTEN